MLLKPRELKGLLRENELVILKQKYTLFIPGRLKKLRFLEKYFGFIPIGGQYFIHATKK
jgi:hypothetical protein